MLFSPHPEPSSEEVLEEVKVRDEAPTRIGEGGRLVDLDAEVAKPGEPVALERELTNYHIFLILKVVNCFYLNNSEHHGGGPEIGEEEEEHVEGGDEVEELSAGLRKANHVLTNFDTKKMFFHTFECSQR